MGRVKFFLLRLGFGWGKQKSEKNYSGRIGQNALRSGLANSTYKTFVELRVAQVKQNVSSGWLVSSQTLLGSGWPKHPWVQVYSLVFLHQKIGSITDIKISQDETKFGKDPKKVISCRPSF